LGRELAWKFLQEKWAGFEKRLGESQFLLSRVISLATKDFTDPAKAKEVEAFFKVHVVPSAERTIKQSVESILANSKWISSNREAVAKFLANY
jgi:aminopeptidase N